MAGDNPPDVYEDYGAMKVNIVGIKVRSGARCAISRKLAMKCFEVL